MQSSGIANNPKRVKGWIFDAYPSDLGEMVVWIIGDSQADSNPKYTFQENKKKSSG